MNMQAEILSLISPANAINVQQRNQQISQFMAMQQTKTNPQHRIVNPMHSVVHGAPISPHSQAGPLSPAALTATIQRVASPHSMKMSKLIYRCKWLVMKNSYGPKTIFLLG